MDEPDLSDLNRLAVASFEAGHYEDAEAIAHRALDVAEATTGADSLDTATCLSNLGVIARARGQLRRSEELQVRALAIREAHEAAADAAYSRLNLSQLRSDQGKYDEASALIETAVEVLVREYGDGHPELALALNIRAAIHASRGDHRTALRDYRRAGDIARAAPRPDLPFIALLDNNMGVSARELGRYEEAVAHYEVALREQEAMLGEEHPSVGRTISNRAEALKALGDLRGAEEAYQRAIAVFTRSLGPQHPYVGVAQSGLAGVYMEMRDHERAEKLLLKTLDTAETAFEEGHPDLALAHHNLAALSSRLGRDKEAVALSEAALAGLRRAVGDEHPDVGIYLLTLAGAHLSLGHPERAEQLQREAHEKLAASFGMDHPDSANARAQLAETLIHRRERQVAGNLLASAARSLRRSVGDWHPDLARALRELAGVRAAQGQHRAALKHARHASKITDFAITRVFELASTRQRLAFADSQWPELAQVVMLALTAPRDLSAAAAGLAADTILRRKGLTADAAALPPGRGKHDGEASRALRELRAQIASKWLVGPVAETVDAHRALLADWERQADVIEGQIAREVELSLSNRLAATTWRKVRAAIPRGGALIEFVRIYIDDIPFVDDSLQPGERYAALLLQRDGNKAPRWLDLGDAGHIDTAVQELLRAIDQEATLLGQGSSTPRQRSDAAARRLAALVVDPIRAIIGGASHWLVCPDSLLNLVPFAALPVAGGQLIDERHVSYLTVGRDLLPASGRAERLSRSRVIADPAYSLPRGSARAGTARRKPRGPLTDIGKLEPLPGTRTEAERIARLLGVRPWLRDKAVARKVKSIRAPRVLHIATHGYFLDGRESASRGRGRAARVQRAAEAIAQPTDDPLLRSGLLLAGFNDWLAGRSLPPVVGSGVLTAHDVAEMRLRGTELAVLSACDAGTGETPDGEGVFGLRRAFQLAGARSTVLSLWKVPDDETADLMMEFYGALLDGRSRVDALRHAQLRARSRASHPYYWAAFVQQGDWRPLG